MRLNPLTCIDFYKADHRRQYPNGTSLVYSNFTPRNDKRGKTLDSVYDGKVVFFGLQYFIKSFLIDTFNTEFFQKPKVEVVAKYKRRLDNSLGAGAVPIEHIEELHDLGYLPIEIRALPEGTAVPVRVPLLTIHNTIGKFYWLTNYLETVMSCSLWKPTTSATIARQYRLLLDKYAEETGANKDFVNFQAHDFSFRGMSGIQDAATSGAAHLIFFNGTDTIPAIDLLEDYYNADSDKEPIGFSVPATEHSVMCMGGVEDEIGTFKRLITETYPSGIVSIVSDTWNLWKVLDEYAPALRAEIEAREGKLVFRPDSGNPVDIICGNLATYIKAATLQEAQEEAKEQMNYEADSDCEGSHNRGKPEYERIAEVEDKFYKIIWVFEYNRHDKRYYYIAANKMLSCTEIESPIRLEDKGALQILWKHFGGTVNDKGYKVLNPKVGLIYGDSITLERAEDILERMKAMGFCSSNIVFGVGSYTYQYTTRDNFGFAMKATYGEVEGQPRSIFKNPITDSGEKKSAKGLLSVVKSEQGYQCIDEQNDIGCPSELRTVFLNGKLVVEASLKEMKKIAGY